MSRQDVRILPIVLLGGPQDGIEMDIRSGQALLRVTMPADLSPWKEGQLKDGETYPVKIAVYGVLQDAAGAPEIRNGRFVYTFIRMEGQ